MNGWAEAAALSVRFSIHCSFAHSFSVTVKLGFSCRSDKGFAGGSGNANLEFCASFFFIISFFGPKFRSEWLIFLWNLPSLIFIVNDHVLTTCYEFKFNFDA